MTFPNVTWRDIYNYYYQRGLKSFVINSISNIVIGLFIAFSPVFLFRCIDISKIDTATKISDVIRPLSEGWKRSNLFIECCVVIFSLYVLIQILQFAYTLPSFIRIRKYFKETLEIKDVDLYVLDWIEILDAIAQKDNTVRISSLEIAQEILRIENYITAFVTDPEILTWKLPYMNQACHFPMTQFFFYIFQISLNGTVMDSSGASIVSEIPEIRLPQVRDSLTKRFKVIGFILFLISPFYLAFQALYLIFHYFQSVKSSPSSLSMRRWSPEAKWAIREYNELPHLFNERLQRSDYFSNLYIDQFPPDAFQTVYKLICFLCGSFIAYFIFIGLFSDVSIVFGTLIGQKSIVWVMALFATIFSVFNGMIKKKKKSKDSLELYEEIRKYIHYDFTDENHNAISWEAQSKFTEFFQPLWLHIIIELCGCIINPVVFTFVLPLHSEKIIDFVRKNSVRNENIGWICRFSNFEDVINGGNVAQNGKIKRSISNFKLYGQQSIRKDPSNLIQFDADEMQALVDSNQPAATLMEPSLTDVRSMLPPPSSPRF